MSGMHPSGATAHVSVDVVETNVLTFCGGVPI